MAEGEAEDLRAEWGDKFYGMLASLKFLPNSPTLVNAGTGRGCLSACFVVSPDDTMDSIMQVAHDAAMIEKWGGGIGFGFSKLRPRKDRISTTHGQACGPIAVMKLYSSVGATLTQGAFRLGATWASSETATRTSASSSTARTTTIPFKISTSRCRLRTSSCGPWRPTASGGSSTRKR